MNIFDEYLSTCCLSESEQKKYYLISRYITKASPRLIKEQKNLYKKGRVLHAKILKDEIHKGEYLLKHIPKDEAWSGAHIAIPFKK